MEICNTYYNGAKILETENEGRGRGRIKITLKFIVSATKRRHACTADKTREEIIGEWDLGRHMLLLEMLVECIQILMLTSYPFS